MKFLVRFSFALGLVGTVTTSPLHAQGSSLETRALKENVKKLRSDLEQRRQDEEKLVKKRRDVENSLEKKEIENRKLKEQLENLQKSGSDVSEQQGAEIARLKAKLQHNEKMMKRAGPARYNNAGCCLIVDACCKRCSIQHIGFIGTYIIEKKLNAGTEPLGVELHPSQNPRDM